MRVCLISDFFGNPDEGMKKTAIHLAEGLSRKHEVLRVNGRRALYPDYWRAVHSFRPAVIHYVAGPSLLTFVIMKLLSVCCRPARTVISVLHPAFGWGNKLIRLFRPDILLTQSDDSERILTSLGCRTVFLPSGVDLARFAPVGPDSRQQLRQKYGIRSDSFVLLHVGNIRSGRGLATLMRLQGEDRQVVIVSSTSVSADKILHDQLLRSGCLVLTSYCEHIEELYGLADFYVFPVSPKNRRNSIELPLSVLEAMACNLPVLATRFGALPRVFAEGQGLVYIDREADVLSVLETARGMEVATRDKVAEYSWEKVVGRLEGIYDDLMSSHSGRV